MENQLDRDEIEIDLVELFFELLKYWKQIAVSTVLVAVIALLISKFLMTPMYESTSELYVLSKSTSITSLTDIQMGTNLTNDYIVVVTERTVLEQVIRNLSLSMDYKALGDEITVNNPSNSRILQITVKDANPELAKAIADELADVSAAFISEKMDQDPPSIISYGYQDGKPVSPSILKNTIIGALLGFVLAAAVIVLAYMFNDTIMTADDIEKKLGLNVLGSLPLEEAQYDGEKKSKSKLKKRSA